MHSSNMSMSSSTKNHRIRQMHRALDSLHVELVRLMVMGEGLNLNKDLELHYVVANCNREVVKIILKLGGADVNHLGRRGRMPLQIVGEMVNLHMVAVFLYHHADPNLCTYNGTTPFDILQAFTSNFLSKGSLPTCMPHMEHNNICLCLELLQSVAMVFSDDKERNSSLQLQLEKT